VFTASAGFLALIKYWRSVEAELEQKRWEKLKHLENSFQRFRDRHLAVIQAFDYPHILNEKYLPLCEKAMVYDETEPEKRASIVTSDEMDRIRELDDFLEFFENFFFALDRKLIDVSDLLVFLRYYIILFGDAYFDPSDERLKLYVDQYYCNIFSFLELVEKKLKREPDHLMNSNFENYPRR